MNTEPIITFRKARFPLPAVRGIIERRFLVNYRCDPVALQKLLPPPFRPKLIAGWGIAGICLIRLKGTRPAFLPAFAGLTSENAAHRIAVQWEQNGVTREGVYIPRRDTNAALNRLIGGKIFPGVHQAAVFTVSGTEANFIFEMHSADLVTSVALKGSIGTALPPDSIFSSLEHASEFFRVGSLGWSPSNAKNSFDGLELECDRWQMEPLAIERVQSSFFADRQAFPEGSATFDSAFCMRNISHKWHARGNLKTR